MVFDEPLKMRELLTYLTDKLAAEKLPLTFHLNEATLLRQGVERGENPLTKEIAVRFSAQRVRVVDVLQQAVWQLRSDGEPYGFIVRAGRVEILPVPLLARDHLLNQMIHADFREVPLLEALEQLSEESGVSLTVDARAKQKAQTPITARFNNDVALQDAVRTLTEMGDLKMVYLVTGIYITTAERARVMEKELKRVYELPTPQNPFLFNPMLFNPMINPMMVVPMIATPPEVPMRSPLAPPLPPAPPFSREKGAA